MKKKYIWPIMTVVICIIIFVFSSQSGGESTNVSSRFVNFLQSIFGDFFSEEFLVFIVRKGAHISIYFLLGIFAALSWKRFSFAVLFCFLYACSDEIHQLFVPGRNGNIADVGIDAIGFVLGSAIVSIVFCALKRGCK